MMYWLNICDLWRKGGKKKVVIGFVVAAQMWPTGIINICGFLARKATCLPPMWFFREQVSLKS